MLVANINYLVAPGRLLKCVPRGIVICERGHVATDSRIGSLTPTVFVMLRSLFSGVAFKMESINSRLCFVMR